MLWKLDTYSDMLLPIICVALAGLSNAFSVNHKILARQNASTPVGDGGVAPAAMTGVATFVDFVHEQNTVCGPLSGMSHKLRSATKAIRTNKFTQGANGAWGAAAGSISPGFGPGGTCQGSIDMVRGSPVIYPMRDLHPLSAPGGPVLDMLILFGFGRCRMNLDLTNSGTSIQNVCDGQNPIAGYVPPACEQNRCGQCYQVTNQGGHGGDASGVGQSIIVQIIDACPATNAWNFCKTDQPDLAQKCMDPGTNSLDIGKAIFLTTWSLGCLCSGLPDMFEFCSLI